jgi:hypothetical protein
VTAFVAAVGTASAVKNRKVERIVDDVVDSSVSI